MRRGKAAKYRKSWPIIAGILVATLLNHALASYVGSLVTYYFSKETLKWILTATFIGFGLWLLVQRIANGLFILFGIGIQLGF